MRFVTGPLVFLAGVNNQRDFLLSDGQGAILTLSAAAAENSSLTVSSGEPHLLSVPSLLLILPQNLGSFWGVMQARR
jgi:hypothetical protein